MSNKLQQMTQLFSETKDDVTRNIENWQGYLTTASRLYKYSFDDQISIHAQRPDATACATMELWNGKMNRWVKSGAKGIALIKHNAGQKPRLEYVFEISDTRAVENARYPYLWEMKDSYHEPILQAMTEMYGDTSQNSFAENLMEFAERSVGEHYREFLHDLTYDLEDSFLEELDDLNIEVNFKNALTVSTQYMVLSRCGFDPMDYLENDDFRSVMEFNTPEVLSHLGNALNLISSEMLLKISDIARNIDIENMREKVAKSKEIDYTKNIEFNTLKRQSENVKGDNEHEQSNLPKEWRLPNSELDTGTRGLPRNSGQIRTSEGNTSQESQTRNIQPNVDRWQSMAAPVRDRQASRGTSGLDDGTNDEVAERNRGTESHRSDVMGAEGNEHQGTGRGSSSKGNDLLLDFVTTDEKSEEYLTAILSHDTHFKNKLEEISAYFSVNFSSDKRAEYMSQNFGDAFVEIMHNDTRLGYKATDNGLTVWKGSYLSRAAESTLSWDLVQGLTNNLVLPNFRKEHAEKTTQISLFPSVEQQIENIATVKADELSSAFSVIENVIVENSSIPLDVVDKIISTGNCERREFSLPLIAGHFAYTTDLQYNAKFLENHYGTGGKGFEIDKQKYSVWFNENGMQIAKGTSVRLSRSKITLSWEQVAEKVRGLLEDGRFANNEILEQSQESYMHHIAEKYSYMYRDRDDGYKNEKLDNIVTRFSYPDCLVEISKHFKDSEKFADMNAGITQMIQDHENAGEKGIMRFKSATRSLYNMADTIKDMNNEPINFPPARDDFERTAESFITQDEFDYYFLGRESSVNDRKIDTYLFFQSGKDSKEKARFLSDKQGLAGHSGDGLSTMSSAKGIEFSRGEILNPYEKTTLNYSQISKKIEGYIRENRYLNDLEKAHIPDFTKKKLAVTIKSFYHYAPKDLERPFDTKNDYYWDNVKEIAEQIDKDGFTDNLLEQMQYALDNTLSDERGFSDMQKAFDNVTAYKNGSYEVYPSKFKKLTPIKQTEKVVDENDITSLARKLENKRQPTLLSDEYGQLTLDFSAPMPVEKIIMDTEEVSNVQSILQDKGLVVSEEFIEYAKEQIDENATTETLADKVVKLVEQEEIETSIPSTRTVMYSDFASEFVKSSSDFKDEEMTVYINDDGKEFVLGYGELGNGTTVWNYFDNQNNDFATVAHISADGTVKINDKDIPPLAIKQIKEKSTLLYPQEPVKNETIARQEKVIQGEQSVIAFLEAKAKYPNDVIGVVAGELLLFYGKDAEMVVPIIDRKLIERTLPELGNSKITGVQIENLNNAAQKLSLKGIDFKVLDDEDGSYKVSRENKASQFIPLGIRLEHENKSLTVESVDYENGDVYMRDVNSILPVFKTYSVEQVREIYLEQDNSSFLDYIKETQGELAKDKTQTPDILFFNDFNDLELDYSKYNDGDVIGYNGEGVKYTVGKSGDLVYTTQTTSITPYGEILGDNMTPEIYEKFKAWKAEQDSVSFDFDGGTLGFTPPPKQEQQPIIDYTPKVNFKITNDDLGVGTAKEKFARNIQAIETLKTIENEHRQATPDEQQILHEYVGFGGLSEAFDEGKTAWASEYTQLKSLLTDDEYEKARASTLNAHYTSPTVIRSMYEALENMGVPTDGNMLDPALGSGNFFGMLPKTMADTKLYGSELDSLTGRIARQLYPNADIHIKGYEKTNFPDNFFDVAIGNVPFGNYSVADKRYDKQGFLIHDYFFGATLDKVRTGGVIAFITSKGTLDKQSSSVREYLAQRADLLGAIRLPNTAFKANAGTEVTSDIIFLQKRDHAPEILPNWVNVAENEDGITLNQYFIDNPQMIMGEMAMVSGQFGMESTCNPNVDSPLSEQLQEAITHLAEPNKQLLNQKVQADDKEVDTSISATPDVRNFSYTIVEDKVYFRENSRMNEVILSNKDSMKMKDLLAVRDKTREIIEMQLDDCSDEQLEKAQAELNILYDSYNKNYGLINSRSSKSLFASDVSYPLLCSLEKLDEEGNLKGKADIFTKRTIKNSVKVTSVDTPSEALAISIAEKASVDIEFMSSLLGEKYNTDEIIESLKGIIFKDPLHCGEDNSRARFLTSDEYLSGNVREKLGMAQVAAETYPEYKINVECLEKVQPKELTASEIDVRIGATWIEPKYYAQFMFELLGTPRYSQGSKIDINYSKYSGEWNVKGKAEDKANPKASTTYGTKRKNAYAIIEDSLNLRDTRIYDKKYDDEGREIRVLNAQETTIAQQKQEQIGEAFKEWVWKDPRRREELAAVYNEIYNSTRPREFDGQHIRFDGMSPLITLNNHQKNAVARTMYGGNSLLAHCVGAGKTFTMIASAMEGKRLGLNQKSLFVVPNHLTEQMGTDIYQLYPGAKVLVATKKDFEPANRKTFCSRIATGDFDIVVIGHSQFEKIPLSVARQEAILKNQVNDILNAINDAKSQNGERYTIKQLEKTKKSLETRLEKLGTQERKDSVVTFEELGVDKLYVDEAHLFKNLFLHTKMRNVAGIGQSEAQKSTDMFTKCQYMDEITGGKGVVFATGTPVSNSMTELYTMMRYLQYKTLERLDLTHFDAWAANFGEKITAIELAPEGTGFRSKTRFAKFFNLPELINIWKEAADIQTADMLNLPVPKAEHTTVVTKPSEFQQEMVENLADRAEDVRNKAVEPNIDNMLKITSDGRKLALDQRLGNDMLPDNEDSKINTCVKNVFDIWEESKPTSGTQIIFCDLSTPHYDGTFNVYDDIKNKLIEKGVPPDEIKFIHDANTEQQKAELFAKVRKGSVRVLIGSTAKCGAGTNIQTKLVALHHTDCPWRPS
ncbi:MAG: DEAD/DEAH box helicase family protein, partial [Brevinema sp.]